MTSLIAARFPNSEGQGAHPRTDSRSDAAATPEATLPGPEKFLMRTVGGPFPGSRVATSDVMPWPLPGELPDPEGRGRYVKESESQLPPQPPESRVMRGAEYVWQDLPEAPPATRLEMIGDQWSWEAVIARDGGTVPREEAERMFREYGVDLPPEGPEEQRFRQVPVSPGAEWDEEFAQDHTGPIHGWKVDW